MIIDVDGLSTHAATGGVSIEGSTDPVIVLIHGAGMDGTIWQLQTRYLAYRGFRAVAVDLPGHGASEGAPLESIAEMSDWVARFAEAAGFAEIHVVGHSMGAFVALDLAARHGALVPSMTLMGAATAMPVHGELLAAASNDLARASALMAAWGHAKPAHIGSNPTPGMWMTGGARALVESSEPGVLRADFEACVAYAGAEEAAGEITCPVTVVIGLGDKMTPPRAGRAVAEALKDVRVIELPGIGHSMMTEDPRAVKQAILDTVTGREERRTGA